MIVYVLVGGMKGTTYVQIIKAALLIVGAAVMTAWVLGVSGFDLSELLGAAAAERSPHGAAMLAARACSTRTRVDFISLGARAGARHRGPAAHPHALLHRADAPEARRSVVWAIWLIGVFYLFTLVLGYGAARCSARRR